MATISIWNGKFGGLSDSKWSGIEGSFAECVGIDGHSQPGTLTVHQKLTKESDVFVDEFVRVSIAVSTGESFWFSYTSGKIWRRSSTGTWLLVHTTVAGAGAHGCLGAMEYNGYLYWATQSRLHRIAMSATLSTVAGWTAAVALDWATFTNTDLEFHPMVIQDQTLFIGDANYVAKVSSAGVFTANALDIKTPYRIKTMFPYDIDLLIGTFVANTVNRTEIIRWDCVSPTWSTTDPIEEVGINAFIRDDNYVYAQAGRAGNLYFYNGEQLIPFKKIPGTYSNVKYGYVHPNATSNFRGVPVFGFSNGAGNPVKQGVYSIGSYSQNYPKVLSLDWIISQGTTSSIEIGSILVVDFDLLVSWKDTASSAYGVDLIDYTAKYTGAYFESMMLTQQDRVEGKTLAGFVAAYNSLPASTGLTFSYSVNAGAYQPMTDVDNTILQILEAKLSVGDIGSLQVKVGFDVNANDAPVIEGVFGEFE